MCPHTLYTSFIPLYTLCKSSIHLYTLYTSSIHPLYPLKRNLYTFKPSINHLYTFIPYIHHLYILYTLYTSSIPSIHHLYIIPLYIIYTSSLYTGVNNACTARVGHIFSDVSLDYLPKYTVHTIRRYAGLQMLIEVRCVI